jgi:hypothetical protein
MSVVKPHINPSDNPHGIDPAQDEFQEVPEGIANWSENINLCCPTGEDGVGFYAHMSRMNDDPAIWEGVFAVFLPDQTLLTSRSFGRSIRPDQACSGNLTFTVREPLQRWSVQLDAMARRIPRDVPARSAVRDGSVELVQAELTWEAASPVWSLGAAMHDQPWGHRHIEQAVHVRGEIRTRDGVLPVDHIAFRDLTAGKRDYGPFDGSAWLTCALPSGRMFAVLHIWHSGGVTPLATGFYYDGANLHTVSQVSVPMLTSADADPHEFTFSFEGPEATVSGRATVDHAMVFSLDEPIGMPLGTDLGPGLIAVECPGRFEVDGERAHGWIERSRRVAHL